MKEQLLRMVRAMAWADERMLEALAACPTVHAEALPWFAHVLAAEHIWLARIQQRAPTVAVWWQPLSLEECRHLAAENAAHWLNHVEGSTEAELAAAVEYRTTEGVPYTNTVADILTHAVTHGAYHRGQVAKALGRAGAPAPNTDYLMYVRSLG